MQTLLINRPGIQLQVSGNRLLVKQDGKLLADHDVMVCNAIHCWQPVQMDYCTQFLLYSHDVVILAYH